MIPVRVVYDGHLVPSQPGSDIYTILLNPQYTLQWDTPLQTPSPTPPLQPIPREVGTRPRVTTVPPWLRRSEQPPILAQQPAVVPQFANLITDNRAESLRESHPYRIQPNVFARAALGFPSPGHAGYDDTVRYVGGSAQTQPVMKQMVQYNHVSRPSSRTIAVSPMASNTQATSALTVRSVGSNTTRKGTARGRSSNKMKGCQDSFFKQVSLIDLVESSNFCRSGFVGNFVSGSESNDTTKPLVRQMNETRNYIPHITCCSSSSSESNYINESCRENMNYSYAADLSCHRVRNSADSQKTSDDKSVQSKTPQIIEPVPALAINQTQLDVIYNGNLNKTVTTEIPNSNCVPTKSHKKINLLPERLTTSIELRGIVASEKATETKKVEIMKSAENEKTSEREDCSSELFITKEVTGKTGYQEADCMEAVPGENNVFPENETKFTEDDKDNSEDKNNNNDGDAENYILMGIENNCTNEYRDNSEEKDNNKSDNAKNDAFMGFENDCTNNDKDNSEQNDSNKAGDAENDILMEIENTCTNDDKDNSEKQDNNKSNDADNDLFVGFENNCTNNDKDNPERNDSNKAGDVELIDLTKIKDRVHLKKTLDVNSKDLRPPFQKEAITVHVIEGILIKESPVPFKHQQFKVNKTNIEHSVQYKVQNEALVNRIKQNNLKSTSAMISSINKGVLNHVIDGIIIQESDTPFPICMPLKLRNAKSAMKPRNQERNEDMITDEVKTIDRNKKIKARKTILKNHSALRNSKTGNTKTVRFVDTIPSDENNSQGLSEVQSEVTAAVESERIQDKKNHSTMPAVHAKILKSWSVSDLQQHLSALWCPCFTRLEEQSIDGEALELASANDLIKISVCSEHAHALRHFVESCSDLR